MSEDAAAIPAASLLHAYLFRLRYSMGLTPSTRRKHWEK